MLNDTLEIPAYIEEAQTEPLRSEAEVLRFAYLVLYFNVLWQDELRSEFSNLIKHVCKALKPRCVQWAQARGDEKQG